MDVAFLLDNYFKGADKVSIDVFDAQTLNTVYKDDHRADAVEEYNETFVETSELEALW